MSRPSDYIDQRPELPGAAPDRISSPKLGAGEWLRWVWRQLTSMRTALLLLLLLAIAAVPGSLVPQRSSDPNGVTQYFENNAQLAPVLDSLGFFDVYSSVWFSAIYLLLFTSLIGCVVPRLKHHLEALRAQPPATPARLERLDGTIERPVHAASSEEILDAAELVLAAGRYRLARYNNGAPSVSGERGYLRETGNLLFHFALVGVLVAVAIGGGLGYSGQRVVVTGQSFVNSLASYDSFNPGRFFNSEQLEPFALRLEGLDVVYETENANALGQPLDFTARVNVTGSDGDSTAAQVKVNDPLRTFGTDVYLLGNGYAPTITVRDPAGKVVFTDSVPFLPQDSNLTSVGVIKVPDGLEQQLGLVGFFYPTQSELDNGAYTSTFPDLTLPMLTLNVFAGDLGIDAGVPRSVYALDTATLDQLTGGDTGVASIELRPGQSAELPGGLGSVSFDDARGEAANSQSYEQSVLRFVSFDIHQDPARIWVLIFVLLSIAGLIISMAVARRRVWVKVLGEPGAWRIQVAALARGDDPRLDDTIRQIAESIQAKLELVAPSDSPTKGT